MSGIDDLLSAAVDANGKAGAAQAAMVLGVVATVSGATLSVTRGSSSFPKVRKLKSYSSPAVGDTVLMINSSAGWVAVGALATS